MPNMIKNYLMYHRGMSVPTEKYYVYTHTNPLTNKVFYVGSAQGNPLRAFDFQKHRSQQWKQEVVSFGGFVNIKIEIVEYCKTAKEAQSHEYELTRKLHECGEAYCSFEFDNL